MKRLRALVEALGVAVVLLAALEVLLRVVGFSREIAPVTLQFGYPNPREIVDLFQPDPRLFWRMRPGSVFDAEAAVSINALGYRGTEPREPRPEGLLRVAVLGDSVAFGALTAWPEVLAARLRVRLAPRPVEVLNFGVPGYTVVQGLRQFEDDAAPLRPDAVVLAYGWNDHWLARGGLTDEERQATPRWSAAIALQASRLRVAQAGRALVAAVVPAPPPAAPPPAAPATTLRRVPEDRFAARLTELASAVRARGAVALVVGLPSALEEGNCPPYLVESGFTTSPGEAIADHARYRAAAERAARAAGAAFLDAQPAFSPGGRPDATLFTGDRIHLSASGNELLAELVERALHAAGAPSRGSAPSAPARGSFTGAGS